MDDEYYNRDDAILVVLARAGEAAAFETLLLRCYPSVLRLCQRLLGDMAEAQDVAQKAALQSFLGLGQLQDPARFCAWLHGIAANLARMALRRRRVDVWHPRAPYTSTMPLWGDAVPSLEDVYAAREVHDTIIVALNDLGHLQREVVVGFYLAGYNYAELAEVFQVPVSTIKWRLFDARRQLRRTLQPLAQEFLPSRRQPRKEPAVDVLDLVEVMVEFVGQGVTSKDLERLVMLCDPSSGRRLPLHMWKARKIR